MDLSETGRNVFFLTLGWLALFVVAMLFLSNRAKRRKKQEITNAKAKWVRAVLRAESEGYEAVLAQGNPAVRLGQPNSEDELKAVAVYQNAEKDQRDAELRDQYFGTDEPIYALEVLVKAIGDCRDLDKLFALATPQAVTDRVNELIVEQLVKCRNGNSWSVQAYYRFVRSLTGERWSSRMYEVYGVDKPGLPIDWDGVVLDACETYSLESLSGVYINMRQVTDAAGELLEPTDSAPLSRLKNLLAYAYLFAPDSAVALELKRAIVRINNG